MDRTPQGCDDIARNPRPFARGLYQLAVTTYPVNMQIRIGEHIILSHQAATRRWGLSAAWEACHPAKRRRSSPGDGGSGRGRQWMIARNCEEGAGRSAELARAEVLRPHVLESHRSIRLLCMFTGVVRVSYLDCVIRPERRGCADKKPRLALLASQWIARREAPVIGIVRRIGIGWTVQSVGLR
jgi:hypothetical protein